MNWQQQTVVITGAGSGMGHAYALAFAAKGCKLALCDISEQGLEQTAQDIRKAGSESPLLQCFDVADESAVNAFADRVSTALGGASVVINNAGIEGAGRPAWALSSADHQRVMNVNYYGVLWCSQAFLPQLMQKKQSFLINVSSVFGLAGTPSNSDYCASKFAVRALTEALDIEWGRQGIRVLDIMPPFVSTPMLTEASFRSPVVDRMGVNLDADDIAHLHPVGEVRA